MDSDKDKLSLKREIMWISVVWNLHMVVSCVFALHFVIYEALYKTTLFGLALVLLSLLGVTAGAHRLWAHQSYKVNTSLRIFLMLCQTIAGYTSIYDWVRLHRLHHKYFQTDLDPYNSKKGFLYSHLIGNVMKLSPAQEKLLAEIDMSDLEDDKVVMFQKRFFWVLVPIFSLLLPLNAPMEYWDEHIVNTLLIVGWLRLGLSHHLTLLIHSGINVFDYSWGDGSDIVISKSHWLSYHYLFPWDYKTGEYGKYGTDCTTKFIRVCAALDLAQNLKTTDNQTIRNAVGAVGDNKTFLERISPKEESFGVLK